jgi:hypothetical protein
MYPPMEVLPGWRLTQSSRASTCPWSYFCLLIGILVRYDPPASPQGLEQGRGARMRNRSPSMTATRAGTAPCGLGASCGVPWIGQHRTCTLQMLHGGRLSRDINGLIRNAAVSPRLHVPPATGSPGGAARWSDRCARCSADSRATPCVRVADAARRGTPSRNQRVTAQQGGCTTDASRYAARTRQAMRGADACRRIAASPRRRRAP